MEDNDLYFVHIEKPKELRKELLESSKFAISSLKNFEENYRRIKTAKLAKMEELKKTVSEIREANERLKEILPSVKGVVIRPKKKDEKILPKITESQLDRLEDDLAAIESDLSKLS